MGRFEIRRAKPSDVPAIKACVVAAYAKWTAILGYEPYPATQDYAAVVRDHEVWVVSSGGEAIGVLVLIDQSPKLVLDNVAVAPAHQGHGLGNLLLAHAMTQARSGGYAALRLYTNERMAENRAWYGSLGFIEESREVKPDRTIVFMERPVTDVAA